MKLLLYCTKGKPYLVNKERIEIITKRRDHIWLTGERYAYDNWVNGEIVAECDYELEEIKYHFGYYNMGDWFESYILENSCLTSQELDNYLQASKEYDEKKVGRTYGYAIHIKNLKIFDKPKELKDFEKIIGRNEFESERCDFCSKNSCENCRCNYLLVDLEKAPQNMMYVFDGEEKKVLISIHPEWLCKILNGEKTIEIRKKVLKEM